MNKKTGKKTYKKLYKKAKPTKKPQKPRKTPRKKGEPGPRTRTDWERNHGLISDAILTIAKAKMGRKATYKELSAETGLSIPTIMAHVRSIVFEPQKSRLRVLSDNMLLGLYRHGMKGSSRSMALWFQLMEGWAPRRDITSGGKVIKGMVSGQDTSEGEAFDAYMNELHEDRL